MELLILTLVSEIQQILPDLRLDLFCSTLQGTCWKRFHLELQSLLELLLQYLFRSYFVDERYPWHVQGGLLNGSLQVLFWNFQPNHEVSLLWTQQYQGEVLVNLWLAEQSFYELYSMSGKAYLNSQVLTLCTNSSMQSYQHLCNLLMQWVVESNADVPAFPFLSLTSI